MLVGGICQDFGVALLRIYLMGGLYLEVGDALVREGDFPSRQVRHAFAYLVLERRRPVDRDELCGAIWPDGEPPASREVSISAVVSKLRNVLAGAGLSRGECVSSAFGCYQLRLPEGSWVDVEAATSALHEAEGALLGGDPRRAYPASVVSSAILQRGLLPGVEAPWARRSRGALQAAHVRSIDALVRCLEWNGEGALAIQNAEEAIRLAPLREAGYRTLMRLHVRSGNRAEALAAYHRCRALLAEELGVGPSPETESLYLEVLGQA